MTKLRCWLRTVFSIMIMGLSWVPVGVVWADLNDGLVAYYPFDGNANDESGNGNHGIEKGDSRYIDGIVNQARHFDRNDGYESIMIPNTLNNDEYSVSLWVNLEEVGSLNSLLMLNEGSSWKDSNFWLFTSHHRIAVLQGQDLRFENGYYGGTLRTVFEDSENLSDNTPYFMVANYKEGTLTLYLNGNVYAQYTGVAPIQNTSAQLNIGVSPDGTGRYQVEGFIDELRIYNRALSKSEIQQLYQPCQPTIDIVLNSNNRLTGDKVVINAHIKGASSSNSSCEQTKVEQKVWVKLPNNTVIPLIDPFTVLTLLPFDSIETKIFEYVFSGAEPIGAYEIGGRRRLSSVAMPLVQILRF